MKTMSWSRYHALPWSFTRIRPHPRVGRGKRARGHAKVIAIAAAAAEADPAVCAGAANIGPGGSQAGFLSRVSRSIERIFRTGLLPAETDI